MIGGVGPLSTAYFMEVLINRTDAKTDQEHVEMIVLNHTGIPDRTAYILDSSKPNPALPMAEDAARLEKMGAGVIATVCNTAHYFYRELSSAVSVPFLNMIEETAEELGSMGAKRVGVLANNGTISTSLFQDALNKQKIEPVLPSKQNQQYVMDIIYDNVKAGIPLDLDKFKAVIGELRLHGCDHVILGCTELSILKKEYALNDFYVDSLEILAARCIEACGYQVKRC